MTSASSHLDAPLPPFPWWGLASAALVAGLAFGAIVAVAAFLAMQSIRTGALGGFAHDPMRYLRWLTNSALLVGVGVGFLMGWRNGLRAR